MIDLLPKGLLEIVGLSLFILIGIVATTSVQELVKRKLWGNGHSRRKDPDWFETFIESTKEGTDANNRLSEKLSHFADVVENMSESINKRADKAINQHDEIIDEIKSLDVPRKRVGRF